MSAPLCVCGCGKPVADGYARAECAQKLAEVLTVAAGHAEDAWTVIARQARVGTAGGTRRPEQEPVPEEDLRRNAVTEFGWQASIERPMVGALRPEPGPADLGAFDRLRAVENTIGTWVRDLDGDGTNLAEAARWLAGHADDLRHHPAAGEAFGDLHDACRQLERLVDRPAERELVGMCDCGKVLYAAGGRAVVQCPQPTCKLEWDVADSRDILRAALRGKLFTAAEAAHFAAHWDDRTSEQIRKLINKWTERGRIAAHGTIRSDPIYLFGDVLDRLAESPPRRTAVAA
jgi:hypothetical protein